MAKFFGEERCVNAVKEWNGLKEVKKHCVALSVTVIKEVMKLKRKGVNDE